MHCWNIRRQSISINKHLCTSHAADQPAHHVSIVWNWDSKDTLPAVCSGLLPVLLFVCQISGAASSRCCMITGSPSLQAMWKEFQPSLFFSAGLAPWHSNSLITSRFLRVQAIIRGVLREKMLSKGPKIAATFPSYMTKHRGSCLKRECMHF